VGGIFDLFQTPAMQIQISLKTTSALDNRNAKIVLATQQLLQEGRTAEACDELRKIERRVASHPAVVQLRRNLVATLYGWEQEDTAISRLQPASQSNGNTVNGNGPSHGSEGVNGNNGAHMEEAVAA
jgi:hypothetical protein